MSNAFEESISRGVPYPYGISIQSQTLNFSIVSKTAKQLDLTISDRISREVIAKIPLNKKINKTGNIWHVAIKIPENYENLAYSYTVEKMENSLLDPYVKSVNTPIDWGINENPYQPQGEIATSTFDFEDDFPPSIPLNDLIIYEMHVRGFTQDHSSGVKERGKFLGIIEKIPHLLELGVNAIELMPIHEFDECEYTHLQPHTPHKLYNYWGYSTVNFFSPMNRYVSSSKANAGINEFKTMVKELHRNGIEIILDLVFNHTAEGGETGPILSFKGFDPRSYYLIDGKGHYMNYSGCGNTFNANHPIAQELIVAALRYWVSEMHVDGFRFDLASSLNRNVDGQPRGTSSLIKMITKDPGLAGVKLIAEPWDATGLYQLGAFAREAKSWSEWNDKYRDGVRRFIKGTPYSKGEFAKRICGSEDFYYPNSPVNSINFITAHDGFTLTDLVSYNEKHNLANGEQNRDGTNNNESWNCGIEGHTTNKEILNLRERQRRNFHIALMLSQGVPMILMGDEYGHTKEGNNNTWCQDNELNWFLWDQLKANAAFYRFYRLMIQFRKRHALFRSTTYLTSHDIEWHGKEPFKPDWNGPSSFIAFILKNPEKQQDIYIAFNAQNYNLDIQIPSPPKFKNWRWIANSAHVSPEDFYENGNGPLQIESHYQMSSYSAIILKAL
jgi:isoamylase